MGSCLVVDSPGNEVRHWGLVIGHSFGDSGFVIVWAFGFRHYDSGRAKKFRMTNAQTMTKPESPNECPSPNDES